MPTDTIAKLRTTRMVPAVAAREVRRLHESTIEIVSDAGEGAQKCGQIFGAVSAKMGNGVWTVEIIPAEIQPPPRVPEGRERLPDPHWRRADHQLGRRDDARGGVQRTGAARPPPTRRARRRCDAARREQVGDVRRRGDPRRVDGGDGGTRRPPLPDRPGRGSMSGTAAQSPRAFLTARLRLADIQARKP